MSAPIWGLHANHGEAGRSYVSGMAFEPASSTAALLTQSISANGQLIGRLGGIYRQGGIIKQRVTSPVLPHVILLPVASFKMLPIGVSRDKGGEITRPS
jgi:hypothetical protein